jgi:hypothetical protein
MVRLGPLGSVNPATGRDLDDPLDALTPTDVAWLEQMADVLPRSMPVAGTTWWHIVTPNPKLFDRTWH